MGRVSRESGANNWWSQWHRRLHCQVICETWCQGHSGRCPRPTWALLCQEIGPAETVFNVHCDVTCDSDVQNAVDTAISKYGKLDIMFSNAGIHGEMESRIILSDNTNFKRVFDVNVVASVVSEEISHAYVASKHAVVGLANNLCVELGQYGIRVNCISPFGSGNTYVTERIGNNGEEEG
ncbi:Secoisolariciresinol dehydrogenase [Vitis vinifera]|uniref:Secoisolariciresinol dehydrogenase n=1 Tax=Vitis vinifera TaxID=29760 RepID=A0A438BP20_VITVI|nr:Secoisolariciresinol dehydrogenase [Vitis vinifera]